MSHDRCGLEFAERGRDRVDGQFARPMQPSERGQDFGIEMGGSVKLLSAHPGSHGAPEL